MKAFYFSDKKLAPHELQSQFLYVTYYLASMFLIFLSRYQLYTVVFHYFRSASPRSIQTDGRTDASIQVT